MMLPIAPAPARIGLVRAAVEQQLPSWPQRERRSRREVMLVISFPIVAGRVSSCFKGMELDRQGISETFGSSASSEAQHLYLGLNPCGVSVGPRDGNPDYLQVATSRGLKPSSIMQGASI